MQFWYNCKQYGGHSRRTLNGDSSDICCNYILTCATDEPCCQQTSIESTERSRSGGGSRFGELRQVITVSLLCSRRCRRWMVICSALALFSLFSKAMAEARERTFIMVKPDGVQRGLVGKIIKRFEAKGFKLVALKFTWVGLNEKRIPYVPVTVKVR